MRGNRADEIRAATEGRVNVSLAGFAPVDALEQRLASADIHLTSLKPEWSGTVVPSKFFGSLAAGRPVLYAGSRDSSIARWIEEYNVGWVLDGSNTADIAQTLRELAADPERQQVLRDRCHRAYQTHFSYAHGIQRWDDELRAVVAGDRGHG